MNTAHPKVAQIAQVAATSDHPANDIDVLSVLGLLWRGRWIIALTTFLAAVFSIFYVVSIATPAYTATALVAFENQQDQVTNFESVVTGFEGDVSIINTEVEVLRSRTMVGSLVDRMNLTADPEFNRRLPSDKPSLLPEFISESALMDRINALRDWWRAVRSNGLTEREFSPEDIKNLTVDRVTNALTVSNIRQTFVFRIQVETSNAEKSALMANTLAELYIEDRYNQKVQGTQQAVEYLNEQAVELQLELEEAESELQNFSATTELVSPEALLAKGRQMKNLRERLAEAEDAIRNAEAQRALLSTYDTATDIDAFVAAVDDAGLSAAARRVKNGQMSREDFGNLVSQSLLTSQNDIDRLQVQAEVLMGTIEEFEADVAQQSSDLLRIQQLEREVQASREIYEHFLTRLKETSVQVGLQSSDARILSHATRPQSPSSPKKRLFVTIAMLVGAIIGVILVVLRELRKNTIRNADELEALTDLTVMGQIPVVKIRKRAKLVELLSEKTTSPFVEAIRNLRTSLVLARPDSAPQIIMISSSLPGEGKTTVSIALAKSFADVGKKVLLVEADIRRRTFDEYFDTDGRIKLVDAVASDGSVLENSNHSDKLGCQVLFGGKSGINAADFFSSSRFKAFIERARAEFDVVLLDTPPVLAVSDARIIGQHADLILYVSHWDKTPKRVVRNGVKSLRDVDLPVSGAVLSQVDEKGMRRYGYGDSYGSYASYGDS